MLLARVIVRTTASAALVAAALATPPAARAQAVIHRIVLAERDVADTGRLRLSRFADLSEQTTVTVGTRLDVGDMVSAASPDANVLLELRCPADGGSVFRFSAGFRLVVLPPRPTVPCVLQLLAGGVDVTAEEPTEINAGGIVLGSTGTEYGVHLRRTEEGPVCEGVVFETDKAFRVTTKVREIELATSRSWVYNFRTETARQSDIPEQMFTQRASVATRFDVARLQVVRPADAPTAREQSAELFALHMKVLKAPADKEARITLGTKQEALGSIDSARYNLKRAGRVPMKELAPREDPKPTQPETVSPPAARSKSEAAVARRPADASRVAGATRAPDPAARALELVRAGQPAEAIAMLKPRADQGTATARDFHALAEAYRATGDGAAARSAAERALAFRDAATVLTPAELDTLRAIVRGGR